MLTFLLKPFVLRDIIKRIGGESPGGKESNEK